MVQAAIQRMQQVEEAGAILLLSGDERLLQLMAAMLEQYRVVPCRSPTEAKAALRTEQDVQVVVVDIRGQAARFLPYCRVHHPRLIRIVLAQDADAHTALAAVRAGEVFRFVPFPLRNTDLLQTVAQAMELHALQRQRHRLEEELEGLRADLERRVERQTQALAEKNTRLESLNRMKDELMLVAAHDIRSPLSVIVGYARMLLEIERGLDDQGRLILNRLLATGNRLLTMVNNILNLAAIEEGKSGLAPAPTRLSELIGQVTEDLAGMIEQSHTDLSIELKGDDILYWLDPLKTAQVLQNVLSNAVKFAGEHGKILLTCRGEPEQVTFSVQDHGPGLTPQQAERVFDKFTRFSDKDNPGSGLGMAISKSIVQLHGGRIWLESQPGVGTTFFFTIPTRTGLAPGEPHPSKP